MVSLWLAEIKRLIFLYFILFHLKFNFASSNKNVNFSAKR